MVGLRLDGVTTLETIPSPVPIKNSGCAIDYYQLKTTSKSAETNEDLQPTHLITPFLPSR